MHAIRLIRVFFTVSVLAELQYRANFVVQALQTLTSFATAAAGLALIFSNTPALDGWSPPEMVALLGTYYLMAGFMNVFLKPSMGRFMEDIRQGTLDYALTKPEDAQFLVSIREVVVWSITDSLLGVVLIVGALTRFGHRGGLLTAMSFVVALLAGAVTVYSFYLILATLAFWIIRVDNLLVIFNSLYGAGKYPVGIYPTWLRLALTFLVPVAFATTVPAEALAARATLSTVAGAVALSAVLFVVARLFWRHGLRAYTGASS